MWLLSAIINVFLLYETIYITHIIYYLHKWFLQTEVLVRYREKFGSTHEQTTPFMSVKGQWKASHWKVGYERFLPCLPPICFLCVCILSIPPHYITHKLLCSCQQSPVVPNKACNHIISYKTLPKHGQKEAWWKVPFDLHKMEYL